MVLNQKGVTKCVACEIEQPGTERKLDASVGADESEALAYSRIGAGGFKFGGLRLQGHPDGSSVSTIFEGLFTEEGTEAWKAIFEGGFNFTASEVRNKFYGTAPQSLPNRSTIVPRSLPSRVMLQFTLQVLILLNGWRCRSVFLSLD